MTTAHETPDIKNISAELRETRGGVGCGGRGTKKQNPLLQTHDNMDAFSKIISQALLLSQRSGWNTDTRRTAAPSECSTYLCCPE